MTVNLYRYYLVGVIGGVIVLVVVAIIVGVVCALKRRGKQTKAQQNN